MSPPASSGPRVLLVQMPWASTSRPSIGLGILDQLCEEAGVARHSCYFNLETAAVLGSELADIFADHRGLFGVSEHLFAADIFGADALASDDFLEAFVASGSLPAALASRETLRGLRDERLPALLDRLVGRVLEWQPTVVGFSATFNQVFPSLALAARLKRARPDLRVICGGACFDDPMGPEYHRALPEAVDHVFVGESEVAFREFLRRLVSGEALAGIPGVTWWDGRQVQLSPGRPLADMDASPMPSYDAFFEERERLAREHGLRLPLDKLLFESSRGCWWGQKNHCVFCGLNPDTMEFRSKSIDRVLDEIVALTSRYRVTRLLATDWIVSRTHRSEIFRRLKDLAFDVDIFFETRSDMSKEEIALMKDAGVNRVQPGIESFSTPLLQLMRKHTRGIRQVQFLRWCRELGVVPHYNLLAGFPGEEPGWYADMARWIPHLHHLDPPRLNVFRVELHRFSPLFDHKEEFGITRYDIRADYRFNLPPGLADPKKTGYFFDFESSRLGDVDAAIAPLREAVEGWIAAHTDGAVPVFAYGVGPDFVSILDTRHGRRREWELDGLARDVLLLCDQATTRQVLGRDLEARHGDAIAAGALDDVVQDLLRQDLLLQEGEWLLTLPVSRRPRATAELRALVLGPDRDRAVTQ